MGLKLELILVVLIFLMTAVTMSIKLTDQGTRQEGNFTELEFYDTVFTEVDAKGIRSEAYGVHGKRVSKVLYVDSFRYKDTQVRYVYADKAVDEGRRITLKGNVRLLRYDGFRYKTQLAVYERDAGTIEALTPFVAYKAPNTLYGDYMHYDIKRKILYAKAVRAVIVLDGTDKTQVKKES